MITTIRELLQRNHLKTAESVYQDVPNIILDFPLTVGDFLEVCDGQSASGQYWQLQCCIQFISECEQSTEEFCAIKEQMEEIKTQLTELKKNNGKGADVWEERGQLKDRKKQLTKRLQEIAGQIEQEAIQRFGYDWKEKMSFCYKNTVYLSYFDDVKQFLPQIQGVENRRFQNVPLFVSNLGDLSEALTDGKEIGIVGGPCLFGIDEVLIHIKLANGKSASYDCSCGRRCLKETVEEVNLEEYINRHVDEITEISFENRKTGITRQEYDSLAYLFAFAQKLSAKAVIPLPDLSYLKYAASDLAGLPEEWKEEKLKEFAKECYKITDLYLEVIEAFGRQYPDVEYTVLHHRNQKLCQHFYEKRAPYIKNSSYMRKLTTVSNKKESVVDYITMLALPYYVYGTKYVLQLDSVDETDSGRKCAKIHKKDIKLTQILYPEYLSDDGKNTIYNAPLEYKEYINKCEE